MPTSGIYRIVNLVSGKAYIGSATRMANRFCCHRNMLAAGKHHSRALQRAWDKHGPEAFKFELIEEVAIPDLLEREQFWIDHYGSAIGKGYNGCPVAGTRRGSKQPASYGPRMREVHLGKPKSAEQRAKMSAAAKGRAKSPEHCEKLRQAAIRQFADPAARAKASEYGKMGGGAFRGRHHTPEARAAMSAAHRARHNRESP